MQDAWTSMKKAINRRSFVKKGITAAGIATASAGLLTNATSLLAEDEGREDRHRKSHPGRRGPA